MPVIQHSAVIHAPVEAVYDLIAEVELFPSYCHYIKSVAKVDADCYHWVVQVAGISLSWDAMVTSRERPKNFAWQSTSGVKNTGHFELMPVAEGTHVVFVMEYQLPGKIFAMMLIPFIEPVVQKVSAEILAAISQRLSGQG